MITHKALGFSYWRDREKVWSATAISAVLKQNISFSYENVWRTGEDPTPWSAALPGNHLVFHKMILFHGLNSIIIRSPQLSKHTKLAPHEYWHMEIEILLGFAEILVEDKI